MRIPIRKICKLPFPFSFSLLFAPLPFFPHSTKTSTYHGKSSHHGREHCVYDGEKHASSEGDGECVVAERPQKVQADSSESRSRQVDGRRDILQVVPHQDDVCALDGHVSSCLIGEENLI
jgi:hypothetical protein